MARASTLVLVLATALLAGCGDDGSPRPVRITLSSPADGAVVHGDTVEVSGRVRPASARVLVGGATASVLGGRFRGEVTLHEGANVIDVGASASGARTAWAALRVARETLIRLPELAGQDRDDAVDRVEGLGLRAEVDEGGGLLDRLLPGGWRVCGTRPGAGAELSRGATVTLAVSKTC